MTWSNVTSSRATWSNTTFTQVGWQQLSKFTEADGVDFVLRVNDTYPLLVIDPRPSMVVDDIEGV